MNVTRQRVRLVVVLFALALLGLGCGRDAPAAPATFRAGGQVKYKDGRPVSGGTIEFRSLDNPSVTTIGAIGPDGKFTLHTLVGSQKVPGAQEGKHLVTVIPQAMTKKVKPVILPEIYEVKRGENVFEIRIDVRD
jgi:hypothetical protein